ncbi:HLA class I histocompatibility antigen, A-36 alpha chain-like [Sinocyclocheilus anshuiensis]|uniref:HLA class I histocompatibility antigen, A-36 alpha chain-like n=1 Tax=Sinocyclocheilus anshuiensis TaxID=1608454 RepID=UPI0007B7E284|nr:PREDICTED: HLA class I histocompatibility antigen, A-36 alpha chain-like [Sinocyclocheilus anshuiensis]
MPRRATPNGKHRTEGAANLRAPVYFQHPSSKPDTNFLGNHIDASSWSIIILYLSSLDTLSCTVKTDIVLKSLKEQLHHMKGQSHQIEATEAVVRVVREGGQGQKVVGVVLKSAFLLLQLEDLERRIIHGHRGRNHYKQTTGVLHLGYYNNTTFLLSWTVKPRVRLIKKAFSDSGGFRVSCLATGFYPRHINLTLFRDGQLVSDHEITGGDLLPNADGTYQMRKSLEIRAADKHRYTCSATHLSLDNKLDIDLECQGETFKQVISSVLVVLALGLVLMTVIGVFKWRRRRHSASSTSDYSSASTTEDNVDKT